MKWMLFTVYFINCTANFILLFMSVFYFLDFLLFCYPNIKLPCIASASCNMLPSRGFLVQHVLVCPTQQEDGGGRGETKARDNAAHRTSRATLWRVKRRGWKWGRSSRSLSSCLGTMFQPKGTEWRGNRLTLFFFWMPRGKGETRQVVWESCVISISAVTIHLAFQNVLQISSNYLPVN